MLLDAVTRWRLARWIAGADATELDEIANPYGRLLALTLRARIALARQAEPDHELARHDALAEVLRYLHDPEQASQLQDAIVAVATSEAAPTESRNRHIDDILDDPEIDQGMIVPNRLPVGLTVLAGRPKVGKSWLLLDAAASIAQGLPVLGVSNVRPGPVNYWALEDNWYRIKARGRKQGMRRGIPLVVRTKSTRLPECVEEFAEDLELYRPRAFFIDTLSRILPPGASMNDSGEMTHALDLMQQLAFQFNCALVIVHHQRKNHDGDHLDSLLGATGIAGAADAILSLSRARGEDSATLSITGRDIEEEMRLLLRWDRERCRWDTVGRTEARIAPVTLASEILRAVGELGHADVKAVAALLGKSRPRVQSELKRLREQGEVYGSSGDFGRITYSTPPGLVAAQGEGDDALPEKEEK